MSGDVKQLIFYISMVHTNIQIHAVILHFGPVFCLIMVSLPYMTQ